jgi:hypothetical protein
VLDGYRVLDFTQYLAGPTTNRFLPLNWYRIIDRNGELTPQLEHAKIEQPAFSSQERRTW